MSYDEMPTTLDLEITLPRCTTDELGFLIHWCGAKAGDHPHFARFVCTVATDELARRMNEGHEACMIRLPELTGEEYSDFLLGSYVLANWTLTANVARFVDDLHRKIICSVAAVVGVYCEGAK
jgi:hypothetical protein